ncbi:MAG: zeta toxin family protein [Clostridiales bacterium]|nr:zeta toxin family protein [Clostridiales bacterium]
MGVSAVHGESVLIAGMIFDASIANGDNIVYSKIGSEPEDIRGIADTLRNNGYTTRFISVELPTEKALERNVNRFNEKRRLIDPE